MLKKNRPLIQLLIVILFIVYIKAFSNETFDADGVDKRVKEPGRFIYAYPGYTDTPFLPGTSFKVHQKDRPQPPRVRVAAQTTRPDIKAPSDATFLFDGTSLDHFHKTSWQVKEGLLIAGDDNLQTKKSYGDFQLHVEWRSPNPPSGDPGNMGNSGILLMGHYELQIYDSYSSKIYADGSAGAVYGQTPPMVNVCRPPGQWQSYDIIFKAPVFKEGVLIREAMTTVFHNGVLIHYNTKILGPMAHRTTKPYKPHAAKLPLMIQGHHSPVAFGNIWIRELDLLEKEQHDKVK